MAETSPTYRSIRFGDFELDSRTGELRKHGLKIKLHGQPIDVLAVLLENPGEMVTREELQKNLWPEDTFVDFDHSLNTAINKLREVLGDSAENPKYVETLPRRGYRFIYPVAAMSSIVRQLTDADGTTPVAPVSPPAPEAAMRTSPVQWRPVALAGGALAAIAAILLALNVAGLRDRLFPHPPPPIQSIAVLPLENLSGDPEQEYFADGMTDALITNLGKISALRVISRTSAMHYKGTKKRLPEIARELNVDALVEGTVLRSGDRVRITANLIHAPTDRHLWAQTYDRDLRDVLALHSEVSRAIAREIQTTVTPEEQKRLASVRPVNPEAHEAYLKGRYFWNRRTEDGFKKAIAYFERSLEKDPGYAAAWSGLADCYNLLAMLGFVRPKEGFPKAMEAATKALQLDETLAEGHTSLGFAKDSFEWDWPGAEREFERSLELNPNYATAHHWYSDHLEIVGRPDEAITEIKRAQQLDPLSLIISAVAGLRYYTARHYDLAILQLRKTLEMDPGFAVAHSWLGQAYEQKGQYEDAIAEHEKAREGLPGTAYAVAALGHAYAAAGKRKKALEILNELRQKAYVSPYGIGVIHVGLGQEDRALEWLERAYEDRAAWLGWLKVDPRLDPLRSDPRFQDLLRRMNFPP